MSLKRTNSAPGTTGAKGNRYFSVAVTLIAPNVRPWNEFSRARKRCFLAAVAGGSSDLRPKRRGGFIPSPIVPAPGFGKKKTPIAVPFGGLRATGGCYAL